jgi:hypothetical protein
MIRATSREALIRFPRYPDWTMSQPLTPPPEERQFHRISVAYRVKLVAEDCIIAYPSAINISMGGILVDGDWRLPVGSHCGVAILLDDSDIGRRVVARGTVVRMDGRGMAIAFSKALDPESENSLRKLICSLEPGAEATIQRSPGSTAGEPTREQPIREADLPGQAAPSALAGLMDRIKPGSARHIEVEAEWQPPEFERYEDIRDWMKEFVMSASMYERYPDGRWTIQLLLKEQNPGTYRYIVL